MAIKRLFVANRGEIALRIVRAAQALDIETVVGVSAAYRSSAAARRADRAVVLGPGPAAKSYLDPRLVVQAAKASVTGAPMRPAVHGTCASTVSPASSSAVKNTAPASGTITAERALAWPGPITVRSPRVPGAAPRAPQRASGHRSSTCARPGP